MKRRIALFISCILVFMCMGCGKTEGESGSNTVGGKYVSAFENSSATNAISMVDELISTVESPYELASMEVEPGYLNGFDNPISGFDVGIVFSPMIGSIPFVGYVFETDDVDALEEELKASANLRWNICTEADEMVTAKKGNLVFFMMCVNDDQ